MLKILIVEDDNQKLNKITGVLERIPDINIDNITYTNDIHTAKKYLREKYFDLLILDIAVPTRISQVPQKNAGLDLLDELMQRDIYKIPSNIIGITAYSDVYAEVQKKFYLKSLTILFYDQASDEWILPLQTRVKHILLSKNASHSSPEEYQSYLAIICALDIEINSVLRLNWGWEQFRLPQDDMVYYKGTIKKNDTSKIIHATCCPRMGMPIAAIASMKLIHAFRPAYIAMPGITAGIKNKANLGDIIVADPCWDWGSGKWSIDENKSLVFQPAPYQISLDTKLREKFRELKKNTQLFANIYNDWEGEKPNSHLDLHIKPAASGASVLADGETAKRIIGQHKEVFGIEMEVYALYTAASEVSDPKPKAFSIKSVVDFADVDKHDKVQKYAAFTSAQTLKYFVELYL